MDGQNQAAPSNGTPPPTQQTQVSAGAQTGTSSGASKFTMAEIFGDDFVKDPSTSKFQDPQSFAKSYKELQSVVGKPKYDVPSAETPAEQAMEFWRKLGVPDTADAYGLELSKDLPPHMVEGSQVFLKQFAETAKRLNIPAPAAKELQKWYDTTTAEIIKSAAAAEQAKAAEADQRLTQLYQKAFGDKANEQAVRVSQMLEKAIPDAAIRADLSANMPNEALVALAYLENHIRSTYGQSDANKGAGGSAAGGDANSIREQAKKLMATEEYRNPMHKDHATRVKEVSDLYRSHAELTATKK